MLLLRQQPIVAASGRKSKGSSQWAIQKNGQLMDYPGVPVQPSSTLRYITVILWVSRTFMAVVMSTQVIGQGEVRVAEKRVGFMLLVEALHIFESLLRERSHIT